MDSAAQQYYRLAKPGIVYGNIVTTIAAFFFASKGHLDLLHFVAVVVGLSLVMASGCVVNNIFDRKIDSKMERTRKRALVTGAISIPSAAVYAAVLGIIGGILLFRFTNILTAILALIGFVLYAGVYTWSKHATHWATMIGTLPGAVPIVAGYTASANVLDTQALILFLILVSWQLPHFYAIAIYRLEEYKEAGIPVLPARRGVLYTKFQIIGWTLAFLFASCALTLFCSAGFIYLAVMFILGIMWHARALYGLKAPDDVAWARSVFLFSLITLLAFCLALSVASVLP